MKNKCCEQYYRNTIGNALNAKYLTQLTILHFFLIPPIIMIVQLFPIDGFNIILRTFFGIQLSIFNPAHGICLVCWLFIMYNVGTAMVLGIFAALYCGISMQFWLKFASQTYLSKTGCRLNCDIRKFRLEHYQQLRLVATVFNQSFANIVVTGEIHCSTFGPHILWHYGFE